MSEIEYKLLSQTQEQWDCLRQFFEGENVFVPPPECGVASVGLVNGEIVSAVILQPISYLGPFRTAEAYRGKVDYRKLKGVIDSIFLMRGHSPLIIRGFVAMPQTEAIAKIAEASGMERIKSPVLVQRFDNDETIGK